MVIREMSPVECSLLLARARLARLGCTRENQPYVVPVSLVYHQPETGEPCLYGVTIPGKKIEWMRANPLVCVEMDEVAADDQWMSVIVFGRYEELPETPGIAAEPHLHFPERSELAQANEVTPEPPPGGGTAETMRVEEQRVDDAIPEPTGRGDERLLAYSLLSTQVAWWERGWASWMSHANRDPAEKYEIIYYKIRIDLVTGHEATRLAKEAIH